MSACFTYVCLLVCAVNSDLRWQEKSMWPGLVRMSEYMITNGGGSSTLSRPSLNG